MRTLNGDTPARTDRSASFLLYGVFTPMMVTIMLTVFALTGGCQMHSIKGNGIAAERLVEVGSFEQLKWMLS